MNTGGVTAAQHATVMASLAKSRGQDAALRIRTLLANEQIFDENNVAALRVLLLRMKSDRELREFVESDVLWGGAVESVAAHVGALKTVAGRERLLVEKAGALVWGVVRADADDVVGLGGQRRISKERARLIWSVVGAEVLRAIWDGKDTAIYPTSRLSADLLTKRDDAGVALGMAVEARVFTARGKYRGRTTRWSIRSLSRGELERVLVLYLDVVASIVEKTVGYRIDPIAVLDGTDDQYGDDELMQRRISKKRAQQKASVEKATRPRGVMTGLDKEEVGRVAADILFSAWHIAWSAGVTRPEGTLNAQL